MRETRWNRWQFAHRLGGWGSDWADGEADPDGVIGEREYDLSIPMRESHEELLAGDPLVLGQERCRLLARLTGLDPVAIWEWGFVERVATGLLCMVEDPDREWGRPVLQVADAWADAELT